VAVKTSARVSLTGVFNHTFDDYVAAGAWSPDGALIAAGSLSGDGAVLDATTGEVSTALAAHAMGTLSLSWSSDGRYLAKGGQDGVARIHDRRGGRELTVEFAGWVACTAWSPTEPWLALAAATLVSGSRVAATAMPPRRRATPPAPSPPSAPVSPWVNLDPCSAHGGG
jgi:WD40 repeat protein